MRALRAFLLVRLTTNEWDISTHRDLEAVEDSWKGRADSDASAALHVGFWRPDTIEFEAALIAHPGRLLVSGAARYALPPTFTASRFPVGSAKDLPLFLALSGWGYELIDPTLEITSDISPAVGSTPSSPSGKMAVQSLSSNWFSQFSYAEPEVAGEAYAAGVRDEETYLAVESTLSPPLRERLGRARFFYFTGMEPGVDDVLDVLKFAPPWLLSLPTSVLSPSTRSANVFLVHSILSIADLASRGSRGVMRLPSMGRKSFVEICERIVDILRTGPADPIVAGHLRRSSNVWSYQTFALPDLEQNASAEPETKPCDSFKAVIETAWSLLPAKRAKLLGLRMGLNGPPQTLQQIGEVFKVTRERVRQIESRSVSTIAALPYWDCDFAPRLNALLIGRDEPLHFEGLDILDPWFNGAMQMQNVFEYVAENVSVPPFYLIRQGGLTYVSRLRQQQWIETVRSARMLLDSLVQRHPTELEARALVEGLLVDAGEELRPELWYVASRHARFADDGFGKKLISYGSGAEHLVEALLANSSRPLHYSEVHERLLASGETLELRRTHSAAANVGLLFGRGVYGAERHFPLTDAEVQLLISETEGIIDGQSLGRQWHAQEICDALEERGNDFGGLLDSYVVSIALRKSESLTYLGRMMWISSASGAKGTANRMDVHQAVMSVLQESDGPLSSEEIKQRLLHERGLNSVFQVQPEGPIVRVGIGMWGLMDRDLPFSSKEADQVLFEIKKLLDERGTGLHVTEIRDAVSVNVPIAAMVTDSALFIGLAQKQHDFAVAKGQYLYLADWGEPRRVTISEAVTIVLTRAGSRGLPTANAISQVEALIERTFPKHQWGPACYSVGAVYDETLGCWSLSSLAGSDDDDLVLADEEPFVEHGFSTNKIASS